jgi:predicted nucleic acid-binding protein
MSAIVPQRQPKQSGKEMMRYLLDTNIISEPFKLDPNAQVIAKLQEYGGDLAIASVTWHELKYEPTEYQIRFTQIQNFFYRFLSF